jgi:hypothetical protein
MEIEQVDDFSGGWVLTAQPSLSNTILPLHHRSFAHSQGQGLTCFFVNTINQLCWSPLFQFSPAYHISFLASGSRLKLAFQSTSPSSTGHTFWILLLKALALNNASSAVNFAAFVLRWLTLNLIVLVHRNAPQCFVSS